MMALPVEDLSRQGTRSCPASRRKNPDNSRSMVWSARLPARLAADLRSVRVIDRRRRPLTGLQRVRFSYFRQVIHIHEPRVLCFQLREPLPCRMII